MGERSLWRGGVTVFTLLRLGCFWVVRNGFEKPRFTLPGFCETGICRCYLRRSLRADGSETGGRHSVPVQTKARVLPSRFVRVVANGSTGPSTPRMTLFG